MENEENTKKLDFDKTTLRNDAGRRPVDFKLSRGYNGRVVVEAKLTTNKQLMHGFETQIEEYKKAEKTQYGIYLVIDVLGGSTTRKAELRQKVKECKDKNIRIPEVIFVDAIPKISASKYKPNEEERLDTENHSDNDNIHNSEQQD